MYIYISATLVQGTLLISSRFSTFILKRYFFSFKFYPKEIIYENAPLYSTVHSAIRYNIGLHINEYYRKHFRFERFASFVEIAK